MEVDGVKLTESVAAICHERDEALSEVARHHVAFIDIARYAELGLARGESMSDELAMAHHALRQIRKIVG